jgi:hypothetical protein
MSKNTHVDHFLFNVLVFDSRIFGKKTFKIPLEAGSVEESISLCLPTFVIQAKPGLIHEKRFCLWGI